MVDTRPLQEVLERELHAAADGTIEGIHASLQAGWLRAFALTASSYTTGQSITWVQTREDSVMPAWERPQRKSQMCSLRVDHVMASAALPFFFPAIEVEGAWYGDGGIRLTAPLSPAIHMGARRLMAISTRHLPPLDEIEAMKMDDYPSPARVMGAMYNAIFLDVFDNDALRLERVNRLLERLPEDQWPEGLAPVKLLLLRPSEDLGVLAGQYEPQLPASFRFMTRGWGTRERRSADMLSLVMFQPDYLQHLIALGEKDAEARLDEINAFFEDVS
jgi:NTE family protein